MCGILGQFIFNKKFTNNDIDEFHKANDLLKHRGPDAQKISCISPQLYFGHSRLSIIGLDEKSNQPYSKGDGFALVFNGEIYNYTRLREQLREQGCHFDSDGDTEVLYEGLKRHGLSFVHQLNGMFAFAFWSESEQLLYIVRDRMGIKPLYWYRDEHQLIFSSEIRPILQLKQPQWNLSAIQEFLLYQSNPSNATLFEKVNQLHPGSCLKISPNGQLIAKQYYDLRRQFGVNEEISYAKLKEQVIESIQSRMVSDVPVGAFLSGGIDSSIVVAGMRAVHHGKIDTFCIGFDEPNYDERKYARLVADKFGTSHTEILYSSDEVLSLIPKAVSELDYPSGDAINSWLVSKSVREAGIKVALSGLGGDELFGGYPSFSRWHNTLLNSKIIKLMLTLFPDFMLGNQRNLSKLKLIHKMGGTAFAHVLSARSVFLFEKIEKLSGQKMDLSFLFKKEESNCSVEELTQYSMPLLLKDTDQMSMAHGLEVRVPLLDYHLVEYVGSLRRKYRFDAKGKYPKYHFVEAFKQELPEEVYTRSKRGFVLPMDSWMRNELNPFVKESLFDSPLSTLLDASTIQQLWDSFNNKKNGVIWSQIWLLAVLGRWMQQQRISG